MTIRPAAATARRPSFSATLRIGTLLVLACATALAMFSSRPASAAVAKVTVTATDSGCRLSRTSLPTASTVAFDIVSRAASAVKFTIAGRSVSVAAGKRSVLRAELGKLIDYRFRCKTPRRTVAGVVRVGPTTAMINSMLPESVRNRGSIVIATSAAFAPASYLASDGQTIVGYAPDILKALGRAAGIDVQLTKTTFSGILTGIQAGRFDGGILFLDTKERQKQANFLDIFTSTGSWLVRTDYSGGTSPCGKTVAVGAGSAEARLAPQLSSQNCGSNPFSIDIYPSNAAAMIALSSGRADAVLTKTDVGGYAARNSNGQLKLHGKPISGTQAPEGVALPLGQDGLVRALQIACQRIVDNGTYLGILKTWGVGRLQVLECGVNAATT